VQSPKHSSNCQLSKQPSKPLPTRSGFTEPPKLQLEFFSNHLVHCQWSHDRFLRITTGSPQVQKLAVNMCWLIHCWYQICFHSLHLVNQLTSIVICGRQILLTARADASQINADDYIINSAQSVNGFLLTMLPDLIWLNFMEWPKPIWS